LEGRAELLLGEPCSAPGGKVFNAADACTDRVAEGSGYDDAFD
jgi:hypothetical protein